MSEIRYIALKQFCTFHNVERRVMVEMAEHGLLEMDKRSDDYFLPEPSIPEAERMLRLHVELGVNFPGVETIMHMRERMIRMQVELEALRRQLREFVTVYEGSDIEEV